MKNVLLFISPSPYQATHEKALILGNKITTFPLCALYCPTRGLLAFFMVGYQLTVPTDSTTAQFLQSVMSKGSGGLGMATISMATVVVQQMFSTDML